MLICDKRPFSEIQFFLSKRFSLGFLSFNNNCDSCLFNFYFESNAIKRLLLILK